MSATKIVTDSACELSAAMVEELGVVVIPHRLRLGAQTVLDGPD